MKLVPKRKQIGIAEDPTIIIQQAVQEAVDSIGTMGGVTGSSAWFPYRLRIPVGKDMYG